MEKCLGCKKEFNEEDMIDTTCYLGEGYATEFAGFFCKGCVAGKEICCYCGQPVEEVEEWIANDMGVEEPYCKECVDEIKLI